MKSSFARTGIKIRNILFATDFSVGSIHAQPYAIGIARSFNSKLYIAHVVVPDEYPSGFESEQEAVQAACREAECRMHALLESAAIADLEFDSIVTFGDTWIGLSTLMHELKADLLVMGTVGRTGARKFLLGSIAEEAMRESHCPVLTVGPTALRTDLVQFRRILYATDFSPESLAAAPYALAFAQKHSSRLTLLHVVEELTEEPYLNAQMLRVRLAELAQDNDLRAAPETVVEMGSPADLIIKTAERTQADLVVIGARGAGTLARVATHFGSIAHKVVTHAHCPVLTAQRSRSDIA